MKVVLSKVQKKGDGAGLPPTSLDYESGVATLVEVETAKRPTVLALIAGGRMRPDSGAIMVSDLASGRSATGPAGQAELRAAVAIVDAPDVSEPVGDLRVDYVVQEELLFAERPASRHAALEALEELDAIDYARSTMESLPTAVRVHLLAELAVLRPGIEALILTSPDRHGGDPLEWWAIAEDLADRGFAVLVLAGAASAAVLRAHAAQDDEPEHAEPEPAPVTEPEPLAEPVEAPELRASDPEPQEPEPAETESPA
jgi:hypothetical protein